jgi:hypothetical protein
MKSNLICHNSTEKLFSHTARPLFSLRIKFEFLGGNNYQKIGLRGWMDRFFSTLYKQPEHDFDSLDGRRETEKGNTFGRNFISVKR